MILSRLVLRRSRRSLYAIAGLLLALLLGGCFGLDFTNTTGKIGPSWDVPVSIPLAHGYRIVLQDVLGDIEGVDTDDDGAFYWEFDDVESMGFSVGGIEVGPIAINKTVSLEDIGSVTLVDLISTEMLVLVRGDTGGGLESYSVAHTFPDFEWIEFADSGANLMTIEIMNAVELGFAPYETKISSLTARLIRRDTNESLGETELLNPGQLWDPAGGDGLSGVIDLDGVTLPSEVEVELDLQAEGVDALRNLKVVIGVASANIVSARGVRVYEDNPAQITLEVDVALSGDMGDFTQIEIADGELTLDIEAPADSGIIIDVGDIKLNGDVLDQDPISGAYSMAIGPIATSPDPTLSVDLTIYGDDISFDADSNFGVTGNVGRSAGEPDEPFRLSWVTGTFDESVDVELDEEIIALDWPSDLRDFLDRINLGEVTLTLVVENGTQFTGDLTQLVLAAVIDGAQEEVTGAWKDTPIQPAESAHEPKVTTIHLTGDNSNIIEILNALPSEFVIGGKLVLVGGEDEITVSAEDGITVSFSLAVSMTIEIPVDGLELVKMDEPIEIRFDPNEQDLLRKAFKEQMLFIEVENHMPIGLELELLFGHDEADLYSNPVVKLPKTPTAIPPALTDANGRVTAPVTDELYVELDEDDFDAIFASSPLFLGARVNIPNDEGVPVSVTLGSEDYLEINASVTFTVLVNP